MWCLCYHWVKRKYTVTALVRTWRTLSMWAESSTAAMLNGSSSGVAMNKLKRRQTSPNWLLRCQHRLTSSSWTGTHLSGCIVYFTSYCLIVFTGDPWPEVCWYPLLCSLLLTTFLLLCRCCKWQHSCMSSRHSFLGLAGLFVPSMTSNMAVCQSIICSFCKYVY